MFCRTSCCALITASLFALLGCGDSGGTPLPGNPAAQLHGQNGVKPAVAEVGKSSGRGGAVSEPIVAPGSLLTVVRKQDVPTQRDGVILEIAVKEGQPVKKDQLLAKLDDSLVVADLESKKARIKSNVAKLDAANKTREEARNRAERSRDLFAKRAIALDQLRIDELTHERYIAEVVAAQGDLTLSEQELKQAGIVLKYHEIRSATDGVVKTIFKQPGEAVRNLETLFLVQGQDRLRAEGLVDVQYLPRLRSGKKLRAVVEHARQEPPEAPLIAHLEEVTGVAVSKDTAKPLIVSSSVDGTVRVWDRNQKRELQVLRHGVPVRAVACTGPQAAANLCLSGAADGKARIWDLDAAKLVHELSKEGHRGTISCVAFSPDGRSCITGGEDKEIILWDTTTGERLCKFPTQHRGAITSLQFPLADRVVSAARDNTLAVWNVQGNQVQLARPAIPSRTGDVTSLGVTPDGKRTLFDQGRMLRLLTLPDGDTDAVLQNTSGGANFTTFAQFSPDGKLVLSAGSGRIQLWRTPDRQTRGFELAQLVTTEKPTCAAFSPDGTFLVVGTRDKQVLIWPVRNAKENIDRLINAEVTLIEADVQSSARQVRVWAEMDNPGHTLLPGNTVTLVIYDE